MSRALAEAQARSSGRAAKAIRLLIVDDSLIARTVLTRLVEREAELQVVSVATSAEDAIKVLSSVTVDVILLDLEMPGMGGLEALPLIIEAGHGARIIVVSSLTVEGAEHTLRALAQGASDTVPKPRTGRLNGEYSEILIGKIKDLGQAAMRPRKRVAVPPKPVRPVRRLPAPAPPLALAIGASTGGIHALGALLGSLTPRLGIPILVTQHLPAPFFPAFARQLVLSSGYPAVVAEDGMELLPNRIHIAPGEAHMLIERDDQGQLIARLDSTRATNGCMPSIDPMFTSLAQACGSRACGVVLTGMGRDGLIGARQIVEAGGTIMAQDEESSAVWGMPRAVAEAGLASLVLSPADLGRRINLQIEGSPCN